MSQELTQCHGVLLLILNYERDEYKDTIISDDDNCYHDIVVDNLNLLFVQKTDLVRLFSNKTTAAILGNASITLGKHNHIREISLFKVNCSTPTDQP